jgi:hypothetical protein
MMNANSAAENVDRGSSSSNLQDTGTPSTVATHKCRVSKKIIWLGVLMLDRNNAVAGLETGTFIVYSPPGERQLFVFPCIEKSSSHSDSQNTR